MDTILYYHDSYKFGMSEHARGLPSTVGPEEDLEALPGATLAMDMDTMRMLGCLSHQSWVNPGRREAPGGIFRRS